MAQRNTLAHLSKQQQEELFNDMYLLKMNELRSLCEYLGIPKTGKKGFLIDLIKQYLLTGEVLKPTLIPNISRAPKGMHSELRSDALILYGLYKNDLRTRLFMKTLVGKHFHFTAFGQDWIRERWEKGKPPTYQEFADMWQAEYLAGKNKKRSPKKEWAFLNFGLAYHNAHPEASKQEIMELWKAKQAAVAMRVKDLIYAL